jgi:hypothetical protein
LKNQRDPEIVTFVAANPVFDTLTHSIAARRAHRTNE